MTRVSIVVLWLLFAAGIALVAFAPATWLDRRVAAATAGRVRLNDAEGTVWRGRGAIVDSHGAWRIPIAWRIAPTPLLRGVLDIEFEPAQSDAPLGRVTLEDKSADLRNLRFRMPAAVLQSLSTVPLPLEPGGELVLDAAAFRYQPNQADGAFDVHWERARLATPGSALDLGNVTAHVAPQGSALVGTIANAGGDARIDGDVAVSTNGVSLRANIAPGPGVPPDIARLLAALGPTDSNGVVHVQWSVRN
ncbi:MAG TPA: type II secretion system protein N [Casimicrobiaceae bacterium]|jgi:hypothetical protein